MDIKKVIKQIRNFIALHAQDDNKVTVYKAHEDKEEFFKKVGINVSLDAFKEIILQEETKLELGGVYKKSFSLIYPLHVLDFINDGNITLIGPELDQLSESSLDFGLFMLIGFNKASKKDFDNLRHFNFVSNGIEGFMIRTIPRRFWCRIETAVRDKFSLEFLGNAIMYLYEKKFKNIINSMELILISMNPEIVDEFIEITSEILEHLSLQWKDKIEEWKKRIDCDYDWECNECPYIDTCEDIKEVLQERERFES